MCKRLKEKNEKTALQNQEWYGRLGKAGERYVAEQIFKDHDYYSRQDKKYRRIVRIIKLALLLACFANTIVLGLKNVIDIDRQVLIGLVISALTTLLTSVMSYFNYEVYWMRNVAKHIRLNSLRDRFAYEATACKLTDEKLETYMQELTDVKDDNMQYWENKEKGKREE